METAQITKTTQVRWQVKDSQTGIFHGTYDTLRGAHRRADKLDAEYGAVRYVVTRVQS